MGGMGPTVHWIPGDKHIAHYGRYPHQGVINRLMIQLYMFILHGGNVSLVFKAGLVLEQVGLAGGPRCVRFMVPWIQGWTGMNQ